MVQKINHPVKKILSYNTFKDKATQSLKLETTEQKKIENLRYSMCMILFWCQALIRLLVINFH